MSYQSYAITPCPKPRQTRSDKWKQRPCVMRYREYADQIRATGATVSNDNAITFVLPMPASWSNKKKLEYLNTYHYQKPDIDNLLKALLDACHKDDSHIAHLSSVKKIWGYQGAIIIGEDNDQ